MVERVRESWNSRLGVILAVSGSAVGLGNFLRFPGQAAEYGGGAFMIAYFISFLLLGMPICWAEWTLGRRGGRMGFNSSPAIFTAIVQHPRAKYIGAIGVVVPVIIYMYYVNVEAWCLGYATNFLAGNMHFESPGAAGDFFGKFVGSGGDGSALGFGFGQVGFYLIFVFILNFILIYRGLNKGIEWFCNYAMPTLVLLAIIILVRVLTLGAPNPEEPQRNVFNGLGFMWNPNKIVVEKKQYDDGGDLLLNDAGDPLWLKEYELVGNKRYLTEAQAVVKADPERRIVKIGVIEQLMRPKLWLAAAGQIFFSLSVGFGVILTYSSYMRKDDDIVLSGLSAASANEFCEVALGGLITLPAAVAFIGVAGMAGMASTFALGFNVLPMVFSNMPAGELFGFLFFFLLFLAAVTSSLSMLQPGIVFIEEGLGINRKQSVAILGFITGVGALFVAYFSGSLKSLDTLDFWVGQFLIYVLATIQIIVFGWVLGIDRGFNEAHDGAGIKIPRFFRFIMKYVSPLFLITVFVMWFFVDVLGLGKSGKRDYHINDLFGAEPNMVAIISVAFILLFLSFVLIVLNGSDVFKKLAQDSRKELK